MKKLILVLFLTLFTLFGISQVKDTVILNEVNIISAFRPTEKTPVTKKTINKEEIENNNFGQEVPMLLAKTPSISSCSDGGHFMGYTYMRLRGIDQTRINFTLNGVPMNEPEDQGFYSSNFPDFLNSMNSIQIQRGVGTTTYGVSSYGGSVNFETVNVFKKAFTTVTGSYGSYNSYRTSIETGTGKLNNKWAFYSRASLLGTEGYKNHSGSKGHSCFFSGGYFGNKHILKFNAFNGSSLNEMAWLGVSASEIDSLGNKYNPNSKNAIDNFSQSFAQIQHTYALNKKSSLISTIYYNRLDGNWDLDLNTFGVPDGAMLNYQLWSNFGGLMVNYKHTSDNMRFNAGIHKNFYERNHAMADKSAKLDWYYNNKGIKRTSSIFIKTEYDIGKLTAFIDAQHRRTSFIYKKDTLDVYSADLDEKLWLFFSPKIGLTYNINKNTKLYISVGQTEREPTRTDLFGGEDNLFYLDSTMTTTNYIDVKSESVTDIESGIRFNKDNFNLQANAFYMSFKDEITLNGALGSNGLLLMENVDNSFRSGLETDLLWNKHNITLLNNLCYMYSEIKSDDKTFKPIMTPDLIINQSIGVQIKCLTINGIYRYVSKRYIDLENLNTINEAHNVDFNMKYKYKTHDIIIGVNNITKTDGKCDLNYSNGYVDWDGTPKYYIEAPRNFYITLHLNF